MKEKNGFIATSLIYSFFLVFITLFLAIIADYLQDKVLLNTIESEIKTNINTTMSIYDFKVGDFINISALEGYSSYKTSWVIAGINDNELILYSIDLFDIKGSNDFLKYTDILTDIKDEYKTESYLKKILYTFNEESYKFSDNNYGVNKNKCSHSVNSSFNILNNCIESVTSSKGRYRITFSSATEYTVNRDSYDGAIYLTGVKGG